MKLLYRVLEWLRPEFAREYLIIRVTSWRPWCYKWAIEWPGMLVDTRSGRRMRVTPVWDWAWFRSRFLRYPEPPYPTGGM